jgi:hypothetical protein
VTFNPDETQVIDQADLEEIAADLVFRLAGALTVEDLDDPAMAMALESALDAIENKPGELPQDLTEQLHTIKDKADRFRAAAATLGQLSPDILQRLADSMKRAGLLRVGA